MRVINEAEYREQMRLKKLNNGKKNASATIRKLSISFGVGYHNVINWEGSDLSYTNRISPRLSRLNFPKGYFETKTVKLTAGQVEDLLAQINLIDFEKWESDDDEIGGDGAEYQRFSCEYSDGSCFEYSTCSTPPDSYQNMCDILMKYCDYSTFPVGALEN